MLIHLARTEGVGVSYVASPTDTGARFDWRVVNNAAEPMRIRSVRLVFALHGFTGAPRMFRHGYQSWSASDVATFGVDRDPSSLADNPYFQGAHHADNRTVTNEFELRSEWFTVIADESDDRLFAGFMGSGNHDGTFRLTHGIEGDTELHAEAFLGDFELPARSTLVLDPVMLEAGTDVVAMLDRWAATVGEEAQARVDAPYQVGWCSWYHYFDDITEDAFRANLALAPEFPFEVFQLDDGYQAAIGDWLDTNDKFPSGLAAIARDIAAAGFRPGIWIAPFLVAPGLAAWPPSIPEWLAKFQSPRGNVRAAAGVVEPDLVRRRERVDVRAGHLEPRGARPPRAHRAAPRRDGLHAT